MGSGGSGGSGATGASRGVTSYERATVETQQQHADVIARLRDDSYSDGTYDVVTMAEVEYPNGYQVTFCQIGDNYSAAEYRDRVNEFLAKSSDGKTSAGKFDGEPEISFHVMSRAEAIRLAKKYNQISVWDWKNFKEIKTGGTGRR